MSDKIECPKCHNKFELTEAVRSSIQEELEAGYKKELDAVSRRAAEEIVTAREAYEAELKVKECDISKKFAAERTKIQAEIRDSMGAELQDAQRAIEEQKSKLQEAQKNEIELRKQQRQLETEKNEFQLKMTRELDAERSKIVEETSQRVSDQYSMKQAEWEKQRSDMVKQMDELRRKAEQGSQQCQGESFELAVENTLRETFIHDSIEPVAKGVRGGDILQVVNTKQGVRCGAILWELKNVKNFSEGWIQKLKDNQREAKAEVAVLVTSTMPTGVERIGQVDGVWVVDPRSMMGIALALRASLFEVAQAKKAAAGRKEKSEEVWDYLNGVEFRGRVQALVESFIAMREDLETEKRAFEKIWSRRDKQLTRAMTSTAGFYGDLQGVIGSSLPEIKALTLDPS
jgi:hypothetical protein